MSWAAIQMPVLAALRERLRQEQPLRTARIALVFHVTKEVANLVLALKEGGADVRLIPSKAATTDAGVLAFLREAGVTVEAPADEALRGGGLAHVLSFQPHLLIDNADLFSLWHAHRQPPPVLGATVHSRNASLIVEGHRKQGGPLLFPVIDIGSSAMKLELESALGTGQSVIDSLIRVTGLQLSGKRVAVVGYGNVGSGIAHFARGLNARVAVAQRSAFRALKAAMDGFEVGSISSVIPEAEIILSATGGKRVLGQRHFPLMREGVWLGNAGNSREEIDLPALEAMAESVQQIDHNISEYVVRGKRLFLLGNGHQFNHVSASPNSSEMMDLSLSLHVLAMEHLWSLQGGLAKEVHSVPAVIEDRVAALKLRQMGIELSEPASR